MKVMTIYSSRYLIKGEWYEVININDMDNSGGGRSIHYHLYNHTDKVWYTNWFSHINFITLEKLREEKLNKLGL